MSRHALTGEPDHVGQDIADYRDPYHEAHERRMEEALMSRVHTSSKRLEDGTLVVALRLRLDPFTQSALKIGGQLNTGAALEIAERASGAFKAELNAALGAEPKAEPPEEYSTPDA